MLHPSTRTHHPPDPAAPEGDPPKHPAMLLPAGTSPAAVAALNAAAQHAVDPEAPPLRGPVAAVTDVRTAADEALALAEHAALQSDWAAVRGHLTRIAGDCIRLYAASPDDVTPPTDPGRLAAAVDRAGLVAATLCDAGISPVRGVDPDGEGATEPRAAVYRAAGPADLLAIVDRNAAQVRLQVGLSEGSRDDTAGHAAAIQLAGAAIALAAAFAIPTPGSTCHG